MNKKTPTLNESINLIPDEVRHYEWVKLGQKVTVAVCALVIAFVGTVTIKNMVEIRGLNKQIAEDKKIIDEGHLDELNSLKEQYDNLVLGIDSGNITLIPDIKTKMTELFSIINKHKPTQAVLIGVDGQLKSSGEYTYRMEYSSTDRTVIAGFLKALQSEKLEYINISAITKNVVDENVRWSFSVTVKIGGISE